MTRVTLQVDGRALTVVPDDPPFDAMRLRALFRARAVDEITGRAPRVPLALVASHPRVAPRVSDGGLVGLVGRPWEVLAPLLAPSARVELALSAPRFVGRRIAADLAATQRHLVATAPAGSAALTLDNVAALRAGQRLLIGPNAPGETAEAGRIAALGPGPGVVTLDGGLRGPHTAGAIVAADEFTAVTPPPNGELALHRQPVAILGRTVRRAAPGTMATVPVANAEIRITGIWRRVPTPTMAAPASPPACAALFPPLYRDYPATATITVENRPFAPIAPKFLIEEAVAGAQAIHLSDVVALAAAAPNDMIAIDADDADRREILRITALAAGGSPNQSARATLAQPLRLMHARQCIVRKLGVPAAAAVVPLDDAALENDPTLLLATAALADQQQIALADPADPASLAHHHLVRYAARSDADGYFRLPPLSRVGQVAITAVSPPPPAPPVLQASVVCVPDYGADEYRLDLLLA